MSEKEEKPSLTAGCFYLVLGAIGILIGGSMSEMGMGAIGIIFTIGGFLILLMGCWQGWRRISGFFRKRS
jgi:hypothetical protein